MTINKFKESWAVGRGLRAFLVGIVMGALPAFAFAQSSIQQNLLEKFGLPKVSVPDVPEPLSTVSYFRAQPEKFAPVDSYADDHYRLDLLAPSHSDWWLVPTPDADLQILLIAQKNYLSRPELERLIADLQEAVSVIPRLTGRAPRVRGRVTIYVYDLVHGPISDTGIPGVRPGEIGMMLRHVQEHRAPLFHEMTHLLSGVSSAQSLNEGIADWVQYRLRPGQAESFVPGGVDLRGEVRQAVKRHMSDSRFFTKVGSSGEHFSFRSNDVQAREDYYYCSWSFVDFLIRRGGMEKFWIVADRGGFPDSYFRVYGVSYKELLEEWIADVVRPMPLPGQEAVAERTASAR